MPIRPHPIIYSCTSCGWSKTVAAKSDAFMPGEFFDACPLCGHAPLETRPATITQGTLFTLAQQIKKRWF
jgi:hypothetical protein